MKHNNLVQRIKTAYFAVLCRVGLHDWQPVPMTQSFADRYTEVSLMSCKRRCGVENRMGERWV